MEIIVIKPYLAGYSIRYHIRMPQRLKRFLFKDWFYVRCENSIELDKIPPAVLSIPALSVIAPIAWAEGVSIHVPDLDKKYLESLQNIKNIYLSLNFPFSFEGTINTDNLSENDTEGDRSALLFSGGVDSLYTYLQHKKDKPDLITIRGVPDIPLSENEYWKSVFRGIVSTAEHGGAAALHVETDIFDTVNTELLERRYGIQWDSLVTSSLTLPGLCAPAAYSRGISTIYQGSTYSEDYEGSVAQQIGNSQYWSGVKVIHDGFDTTRQEKLHYLCRKNNRRYLENLRVCGESADPERINCGRCEKCLRTAAGLMTEGIDPVDCNLTVDETTPARIKELFENGVFPMNKSSLFMWQDIQKHIPEEIENDFRGSRDLLTWLRNYDFSAFKKNRLRRMWGNFSGRYRGSVLKPSSLKRKIKSVSYITLSKFRI